MTRHRIDLLSLVPGLLFTGIALLALSDALDVDLLAARYVWPALLVVLGVAVLASAGLGRTPDADPGPEPDPDDEPDAPFAPEVDAAPMPGGGDHRPADEA